MSTGSSIVVKNTETEIGAYSQYSTDPTVFYIVDQNNFKVLSGGTLSLSSDYQAHVGRDK